MNDRKEKLRHYKETSRPMGVVRVFNSSNGKSLVEASRDTRAALNRHQFQLKMGSHRNASLAEDWNQLGPEVFRFEVLDTLEPAKEPGYDPSADLATLEEIWLEKLNPYDEQGYNQRKRRD
jgi:hypothetical protein